MIEELYNFIKYFELSYPEFTFRFSESDSTAGVYFKIYDVKNKRGISNYFSYLEIKKLFDDRPTYMLYEILINNNSTAGKIQYMIEKLQNLNEKDNAVDFMTGIKDV